MGVAIILAIVIILSRLFYLQILRGEYYAKLGHEIILREEEVIAKRGRIFDRNGKVLADTRPYFELVATPQYLGNIQTVQDNLSRLFDFDGEDLGKKLASAKKRTGFNPVVLAEDIPYDWIVTLRENKISREYDDAETGLAGIDIRSWPLRTYVYPELFAHVVGYLGEIDPATLLRKKIFKPGVYSSGDLTGKMGVEKTYDMILKGVDGINYRVVDARGREINTIPEFNLIKNQNMVAPVPGYDLKLSIDYEAQLVASEFYKDKLGAVVAMDPRNGEIIALYSAPTFDGNKIMKNIDRKYWSFLHDPKAERPLFNRAIQARYAPGSTYKPVTLLTALDMGIVDPQKTRFNCGGGMQYGNRFFKCWNKGGHGTVDFVRSLGQSCDVYFYNIAKRVGPDDIAERAHEFGMGHLTNVDLPDENSGLIPTKAWKEKYRKDKWYDSETLSIAIGQSYNGVTIIQNAKLAAMIANNGMEVTPHVGMEILTQDNKLLMKIQSPLLKTHLYDSDAIKWIQKGMIEVVHGDGTAKKLKVSPFKIAGKTGTSQVVGHDSGGARSEKTQPHALFIAFAPYDNPQIVVSVMVENGRGGSSAAAPVAHKIIDAYLAKTIGLPQTVESNP